MSRYKSSFRLIFAGNTRNMEAWEFDFRWLRVRHMVKDRFGKENLPDLNAILFLVGVQELGRWRSIFSKEEKQDLIHVAICRLLSYDGIYEFGGRDQDGWPHWRQMKTIPVRGVEEQEQLLKEYVIQYFADLESENGGLEEKIEEE